jgi:hypothetical protein
LGLWDFGQVSILGFSLGTGHEKPPLDEMVLYLAILMYVFFFFFLISQNIYKKAQRGATQSTQEVYKGSLRGGGEVIKKI